MSPAEHCFGPTDEQGALLSEEGKHSRMSVADEGARRICRAARHPVCEPSDPPSESGREMNVMGGMGVSS